MTAPTPREIAETLRGAKDTLGELGWCQGNNGEDEYGRICAARAIARASKRLDHLGASLAAFSRYLGVLDIPKWNDAPGRTQPEVEKALLQAADRIEVGE